MLFEAVIESLYVNNAEVIGHVLSVPEASKGFSGYMPLWVIYVLFKGEISSFVTKITLLISSGFHTHPLHNYRQKKSYHSSFKIVVNIPFIITIGLNINVNQIGTSANTARMIHNSRWEISYRRNTVDVTRNFILKIRLTWINLSCFNSLLYIYALTLHIHILT